MRRYGDLWSGLASFENLYVAARKARRGKRNQGAVERFEFDLEGQLVRLREEQMGRTYRPGPFRTFMIYDPNRPFHGPGGRAATPRGPVCSRPPVPRSGWACPVQSRPRLPRRRFYYRRPNHEPARRVP